MSLAVAVPTASLERPLRVRSRPDLVSLPQRWQHRTLWAVKDPVALRYFHLSEEEYWLLKQLDGGVTPAELQQRFARRFPTAALSLPQLQTFLATLHQSGLIVSDVTGQADELLRRFSESRQKQRLERWSNPLAIRFRGIDPGRGLDFLLPLCSWLFSAPVMALCGILVALALLLVTLRFDTLITRLPEREAFFGATNLLWLAGTIAATKVLHELGHALVCRRFGGRCHEIGFMLLVFTPCLYCNVTDAWMFPSRWRRAAVGAAGMGVEVVLAAGCTFLWWFSEPGLFNSLCLNTMVVCSVNTLLLNGNPLLRYDGYFVLSDLTETPNLGDESTRVLMSTLGQFLWGPPPTDVRMLPLRRTLLCLYAVASFVYRTIVLAGVLWFFYMVLRPHRTEVLVELLAVAVLAGWLTRATRRGIMLAESLNDRDHLSRRRAWLPVGILGAAFAALLLVPFPFGVYVPALLEPAGASRIYAPVSGTLAYALSEGTAVAAGETIATLKNSDLELEVERLRGERDRQRLRVATLKSRQGSDPRAAAQLPPAEELLADLEERLKRRLVDQDRLQIVSPVSGVILPPRGRFEPAARGKLSPWTGTPLAPENRDCQIELGTLLCLVGDPQAFEAILVIAQSEIDLISVGQAVSVQLNQDASSRLMGRIVELAQLDLETAPAELLSRGEIPTTPDAEGRPRPLGAHYQARVELKTRGLPLLQFESGRARVEVAPRSLAARLLRAVRQTFRIELALPSAN